MDDTHKFVYGAIAAFVTLVILFVSFTLVMSCENPSQMCIPNRALMTLGTPIPTIIPATMPAPTRSSPLETNAPLKCRVAAVNLIAAWVDAKYPETDPFTFTDVSGQVCTATFTADVQPLFTEPNLWYSGAIACATCHNSDITKASASMDLSSYQGMLMGGRRPSPTAQGEDIFGAGVWNQSKLYEMLVVKKLMPLGRPPQMPADGPLVFAGAAVSTATPTP
jgi:hypothetical protein